MLDQSKRDAVYLAILWLLIMEAFSLAPPGQSSCVVNPQNYGAYYAQNNECPPLHIFLIKLSGNVLNILGDHEWMLAIFTGLVAIFTYRLWFTTERDTRILQRAYVSVTPLGIEQYKSLNGMLSCDVGFFNAGNLPAQNVRWIIQWEFDTNGLREKFELTKEFSGNNIIPPKTEMRKGGDAIIHTKLDEFQNGGTVHNRWLYVWGRVAYQDGFGKDRFTDFCHRYNVIGARNWTIDKDAGRYHEYGNRTDESVLA